LNVEIAMDDIVTILGAASILLWGIGNSIINIVIASTLSPALLETVKHVLLLLQAAMK
jgi:hypothetical protein